ncbi:MAG: hypothetical protein K9J30_14225 [Bacteroidales bacterium]|nr:hypothetical protein [Bacteroidales bacterium]
MSKEPIPASILIQMMIHKQVGEPRCYNDDSIAVFGSGTFAVIITGLFVVIMLQLINRFTL